MNALTLGFAQAYAPAVRANAVLAGPFRTDIAQSWDMAAMEKLVGERYAMARIGEPSEIVGAVLYLASPLLAPYTTGSLLRVDGGRQ